MSFADYAENAVLDHVFNNTAMTSPTTVYLQLHTADPTDTGTVGVSTITGNRPSIAFGSAASGVSTQSGTTSWTTVAGAGLPETISHYSIWDANTGGNCLATGAMDTSKVVSAGDDVDVSGITITLT
jgi:hypothetical protein